MANGGVVVIRALVFDMDGVLIDAREWHYRALNMALGQFGFHIGHEEHLAIFDGLPTRVKLEKLSEMRGLSRELHSSINRLKQAYTAELASSLCKPCPVHQKTLRKLRSLGYGLALASNSIRSTVDLMMDRAGLASLLDFTLSNEDVTCSKPSPEIYQTAIARFGVAPRDCLVIEDNENGIAAATASGANVMVVRNPDDVYFDAIMARIEQCDGVDRESALGRAA